jgi:hypothetical protein
LIAEDGKLAGIPWGVVDYHPDKCGDDREHIHVVWQDNRELGRVYIKPFLASPISLAETDVATNLAVRDFLMGRIGDYEIEIDGTPVMIKPGYYSEAHKVLENYRTDDFRQFFCAWDLTSRPYFPGSPPY